MAFELPPHHQLPAGSLGAVAASFGLQPQDVGGLPNVGISNAIYALGKGLVLRVPARRARLRAHPGP